MAHRPDLRIPVSPQPHRGYMDIFSVNDSMTEPLVLDDGTSVLFPHDWMDEDADKWRKGMELQPGYAIARAFDQFH